MEVCRLDWGAIATLITGGIALLISLQWRGQKKSELLSVEAAKILVTIQGHKRHLSALHSLVINPLTNDNNNNNEIDEFRKVALQLRDQSFLFSELVSSEKDLILQIEIIAAKYYGEVLKLDKKPFIELHTSEINTLMLRFNDEIKQPRDILINYYNHENNTLKKRIRLLFNRN